MPALFNRAVETITRWTRDAGAFAREALGVHRFESGQREVLESLVHRNQVAYIGSKGTGKTTAEAWAIWWYLLTRPHANVAITSISGDNLRDGLVKECAKWYQRSPVLQATFDCQASRITAREFPSTWWASFRTWSKTANAQEQALTLAGLHSEHMLFVIDEAGSIPQAIVVTAQAALTSGPDCKLLLAGNPTDPNGPLYHGSVTHAQYWAVVHVTGDPDDPQRSALVDRAWAQQQIDTWGRDNPWVVVNVLGKFPAASLNALLGVDEVTAAMERRVRPEAYQWAQKRLGVDCARFGDDVTVLFPRQGLAAFRPVVMRHARNSAVSIDIANRVLAARAKWGTELELLDATGGFAAGTIDILRAQGIEPIDIQFHAPAYDRRYANKRAELYFALASWVHRGGTLPKVPELIGELTGLQFTFNAQGQFLLESKDQLKARLGRSPDRADALACSFGMPEMPAAQTRDVRYGVGRALTECDPWAEIRRREH